MAIYIPTQQPHAVPTLASSTTYQLCPFLKRNKQKFMSDKLSEYTQVCTISKSYQSYTKLKAQIVIASDPNGRNHPSLYEIELITSSGESSQLIWVSAQLIQILEESSQLIQVSASEESSQHMRVSAQLIHIQIMSFISCHHITYHITSLPSMYNFITLNKISSHFKSVSSKLIINRAKSQIK